MILALATLAFADDTLPARPQPPAPVPGECTRAYAIAPGAPLAPELFVNGKATCGGVLLPTSDSADLLATEVWARELDGTARVLLAAKETERQSAEERAAWWKEQASRPAPKQPKPGTMFGIGLGAGLVGGVALTVAGAYAVHLVADAP